MIKLLGYVTAGVWQALSIVVLLGLMHGSANMALVNLVMAAIFAGCAAFFAWRAKVVKALRRRDPDAPEMRRFVVVECLSGLAVLLLGLLLLAMATFRVFSEGFPVFG